MLSIHNYPSEAELGIEPTWFTGRQWASGEAQRESKLEFLKRVQTYHQQQRQPRKPYQPRVCAKNMSLLDLHREIGKLRQR